MIHQHILAAPRPGLSEAEFQDYWRYVHALKYARKIPQIRKYKVNSRIDIPGQPHELNYSGIAEIWIDNEEMQIASVQTPEFLDGALHDEPNWAASWQTIGLDTDAHAIYGDDSSDDEFPEYKVMLFHKKKRSMSIDDFRSNYLEEYAESIKKANIYRLNRILCCTAKQRLYQQGQSPPFDAVTHLSTDSRLDLKDMVASTEFQRFLDPLTGGISEWWGVVSVAVRSEWIVGPETRAYPLV